jgi:hypothetical protein
MIRSFLSMFLLRCVLVPCRFDVYDSEYRIPPSPSLYSFIRSVKYPIPSELGSQTTVGLASTQEGDHHRSLLIVHRQVELIVHC